MPGTSRIDEHLAQARSTFVRLSPEQARNAQIAGGFLVDIRPAEHRRRDGTVAGAIVIDRNVLEWRLDPTSPWRIAELERGEPIVALMCTEGFASSLAAATLRQLGLRGATDVAGGFLAWRDAGLPIVAPEP